MNVDIREATPADASDIADVAKQAWYEVHAPIIGEELVAEFLGRYYDTDSLRAVAKSDERVTYVADHEDGVVGFVSGGPDEDERELLHLSRIYLLPEYWGEGIGSRLLDTFEQQAIEQGHSRIRLRVMVDNEQAVGFYESTGFDRRDERYDELVKTNSYVYVKELDGRESETVDDLGSHPFD